VNSGRVMSSMVRSGMIETIRVESGKVWRGGTGVIEWSLVRYQNIGYGVNGG